MQQAGRTILAQKLLRLIAGLDQPTAGTIRLGGNNLAGVPPHVQALIERCLRKDVRRRLSHIAEARIASNR